MTDEIDVTIADREDQVPMELFDEIVTEYQRNVLCDGLRLVVTEG
jgi:hypothetical protein